jgi:UDPglucose 6-dehydrogenase
MRDFLAENALINLYDPKVEQSQIWADLAEACPTLPLESSKSHSGTPRHV